MNDLEREIHALIDEVREGRTVKGTISVSGFIGPPAEDVIAVGLARFQSYRARTEAALVQEITDLVEDCNAQYLTYEVLAESGIVRLEV